MDSEFLWTFTTLAIILPLTLFLIRKSRAAAAKLPPGPKTLPIIGNMHQMSSLAFRTFIDLSKQYGPLMRLRLGEVETIVVSSPEIAKEVLKQNDPSFADRPHSIAMEILWCNNMAFSPYGEYWKQMRRICVAELLNPQNVRSFGTIRKDAVSTLIDRLRLSGGGGGEPINFSHNIFSTLSSVSCRAAFGTVSEDREALIRISNEGMKMAGGFEIADFFPSSAIVNALSFTKMRLRLMRRRTKIILDDLIDKHRTNLASMPKGKGNGESGTEDFVDVMLRLQEKGGLQFPLENDNIIAVIFDLFAAGTDTTSTALDWAMVELMRNPRVMAKVQAEIRQVHDDITIGAMEENDARLKYLNLVIKETLRLHPSAPIIPRAANSREDLEVDGYRIPAKARVLVNIWGIHRDPKYWTNPERFEPERFEDNSKQFLGADFDYLPFGAGKRMCPGITFAMTSTQLILAQLLYHFDWKLPEGVKAEGLNMMESAGLTSCRKEDLYVVPTPYNNNQ